MITPCLNAEKFLSQYLSALSEWKRDFVELIVVDGKSRDSTVKLLEKSKNIDLLVSEKDEGLYDAMNKGIGLARGTFIGILNIDDEYLMNTFDIVKKICLENPNSVVYGGIHVQSIESHEISYSHRDIDKNMIAHPAMFIPKAIYEEFGRYDLKFKIAADYDLTYKLVSHGVDFINSGNTLAKYLAGGFSSKFEIKSIIESTRIQRRYGSRSILWLLTVLSYRILRHKAKRILSWRKE